MVDSPYALTFEMEGAVYRRPLSAFEARQSLAAKAVWRDGCRAGFVVAGPQKLHWFSLVDFDPQTKSARQCVAVQPCTLDEVELAWQLFMEEDVQLVTCRTEQLTVLLLLP